MKKIKTIEKHVENKEVVEDIICDLCGQSVHKCEDSWDSNNIKIEAAIGSIYPEGDFRQLYITDVCGNCFLNKVKPTLEQIGIKFRELDSEERYSKHE